MTLADDILNDIDRVILNEDDLAVSAILRVSGLPPATISVIFTEASATSNPLSGEVETTAPEAFGKATDFADATQGDILEIASVRYALITGPIPDGHGGITVALSRNDI